MLIFKTNNEARLDQDFKPLVEILMQKYQEDAKKASKKPCLPGTMEQVEREYNLIFPENTHSRRWKFTEPSTVSDIQVRKGSCVNIMSVKIEFVWF